MNNTFGLKDVVNLLIAVVVAIIVFIVLSEHYFVVRLGGTLIVALLMFGATYLLLNPKSSVELLAEYEAREYQNTLVRAQEKAKKIANIAKQLKSSSMQDDLNAIAVTIKRIATKCLERNYKRLTTKANDLEQMTDSFIKVIEPLTGDITLAWGRAAAELREIQEKHVPNMLQAVGQLDVEVDEEKARAREAAEHEFGVLTRLYGISAKARDSVDRLMQIISEKEKYP